jgi:hypothetical protein
MELLNEQGIGLLAVGMPIIIIAVVFFFIARMDRDKNQTILQISRNINDPEQLAKLSEVLGTKKTSALQLKRSGMSTLFVGIGLYLFGLFFLGHILRGVGALVACIGLGVLLSGYFFPDKEDQKA